MTKLDESTETTEAPAARVSPASAEATTSKGLRLWLLLIAHVILGLFFSIWSAVQGRLDFVLELLLFVPVIGFTLAQTALLGFWAAFAPARWWMRLAGLIVGIIYLECLVAAGDSTEEITWLAAMSTGGIAAIFGLIRWRYAELRRFSQQDPQDNQEGLRLSIRGLLLFTFMVALMIVGVEGLRKNVTPVPTPFLISVWSLCFVVTGLAGTWTGLGLARPMLRSIVVLLISAVLGALFVYCIRAPWQSYFYITATMVLQAGVLITSLLVVRSCGFRLVRKTNPVA